MGPILDEETQRAHRQRNLTHSVLLFAGMGTLLALPTWLIWGAPGLLATIAIIVAITLLAPQMPPAALMRLYRARPIDPVQGSRLPAIIAELAQRAEMTSVPRLYVIPSMALNAFAAGTPSHAAIAVTEGLLRRLTLREIVGVLAHEMSHIKNNDLSVMGLADIMSRITHLLSYAAVVLAVLNVPGTLLGDPIVSWWAIVLLYAAPALSNLLQLGLSRAREYDADLEGALITGDPIGLASALRRLETYTGRVWEDLMLPVPARRIPMPSLLRSHPDTEQRIARLVSLKGRPELPQIVVVEEPMVSMAGWGPIEMRPRYRFPGLWY